MSANTDDKFVIFGESSEHYNIDKRGIGAFIFDACDKYANKTFQVAVENNKCETYYDFKKRTTRLAISLINLGVTRDDVIATFSYNSLDNLLPIVASLYIGAKTTTFDPLISKDEQKYLINIVKPKIIFTEQEWLKTIQEYLPEDHNSTIVVMEDSIFLNMMEEKHGEKTFKPVTVDCHETAFIFYSSGSTSMPKGICVSHYALLYSIENQLNKGYSKLHGFLSIETAYWSLEVTSTLMIFKSGAYRVVCGETDFNNIEYLLGVIQNYKISYAVFPSTCTYFFTNANVDKYDVTEFQIMIVTGSKLSPEWLKNLRKQFRFTNIGYAYGQTEIQHVSQFHLIKDRELYLRKPDSVGKLANGISAKIVDINTNVALGPNAKGELRIKSPSMMNGYYHNNEKNLDEFGYYKTGDIAYYDEEECLYIVNRISDMFKFKDYIILPFFIEECIMKHEAVKEAVVFGTPHKYLGESPSALVTLNEGYAVKEAELIEFTNAQLCEKDKLVGGLKIVKELPKTCTQKVIRSKSRKIFLELK